MVLTLTIMYPGADAGSAADDSVVTLVTTTDSTGNYSLCNLLADEDYNTSGSATQPTFTIAVTPPTSYELTTADQGAVGATQDFLDSDLSGVTAIPVQGLEDTAQLGAAGTELAIASYDFGLVLLKETDFAAWLAAQGFTGLDVAADADPDMDGRTNLEEFAFCLKAGSGLNGAAVNGGSSTYAGYCVTSDGLDINGSFLRPEGVTGLTYTLQYAAELDTPAVAGVLDAPTATTWTDLVLTGANTTVTSQGDGSELVEIGDLETLASLTAGTGFTRILITLDSPATSVSTKIHGWQTHTIENECETFALPFEEK